MKLQANSLLVLATAVSSVAARDIPDNIRAMYDNVRARGSCSNKLADGFYATDRGPGSSSPHTLASR